MIQKLDEIGVGELMINSIDRDGTMKGYDLDLLKKVTAMVKMPVIVCGGAGSVKDFDEAINECGASACAAGSMFVFHGKHRAVLISYPEQEIIKPILNKNHV